jgi:hypothetical protein
MTEQSTNPQAEIQNGNSPIGRPAGWNARLREQLSWHWEHQARPRLTGLTDEEYRWEPVPQSWNVRSRTDPSQPGSTDVTVDFVFPEPDPAPFTTIGWRLAHLIVGVFGMRNASHFGRDPIDYQSHGYAATADEALAQLDAEYATWMAGVETLGADGLERPCGPAEGPYAELSMADLVLHIHREAIHHLSEVALLRDLYLYRSA